MSKPSDWSAESLEKAAKFMRELDKSANSRAAMELARRDQDVEIARSTAQAKEYEMQRVAQAAQMARIQAEEQRKTAEHKAMMDRVRTLCRFHDAPCELAGSARLVQDCGLCAPLLQLLSPHIFTCSN